MKGDMTKTRRLVALFLLGAVLFNYPILSLFNLKIVVLGFPLLYIYLFVVWAILIVLMALVTRSRSSGRRGDASE